MPPRCSFSSSARINHVWIVVILGLGAWWFMLQSGVHAASAGVLVGLSMPSDRLDDHDPLNTWQHRLEPWSAVVAVPLFALVSAGVPVNGPTLAAVFTTAVPLGILLGLVVGNLVGITVAGLLTTRFTRAGFATGIGRPDVVAASQLAGIGFTVALLMCDLAFATDDTLAGKAKAAVLLASLVSAVLGGTAASLRGRVHARA